MGGSDGVDVQEARVVEGRSPCDLETNDQMRSPQLVASSQAIPSCTAKTRRQRGARRDERRGTYQLRGRRLNDNQEDGD